MNERMDKRALSAIVDRLAAEYSKAEVAEALDAIKDLSYTWASRSGLTVSIDDVKTPASKRAILAQHEVPAAKIETPFRRGLRTYGERSQQEGENWNNPPQKNQAQ